MTSHSQRKSPAKRLFRMIGPQETEPSVVQAEPAQVPPAAVAVIELPEQEIPKKRGPKPKFGVTMTPAERKAASRENQKAKLQDAERRKLIAELMKIYRWQQSFVVKGKNRKAVDERHAITRQQHRQYLGSLEQLSITELQSALQTQKETPDSHGRLHNERSGEGKRMFGQSEIERIFAAKQHDSSLVDLQASTLSPGDLFGISENGQDPQLAAGYRTKPEGRGGDTFDKKDETADNADSVRSGGAKPWYVPTTEEKWRGRAVQSLIGQMKRDETGRAKCLICDGTFLVELGAENHLQEQYGQGDRDDTRHKQFLFALADLNSKGTMPGMGMPFELEPRSVAYQHYKRINLEIDVVRKRARKKTIRDIPISRP